MNDDVVIVGGGPAGSATALRLARAGVAVRVIERAAFPRRKVCGEYLSGGAVATLDRLGVLDRVRVQAAPLHGVRLVAAGAPPVALPFGRPALACARETLDALLLDAAAAAGAVVERGRAEELLFDEGRCGGVGVRTPGGALEPRRARIVAGADGIGSVVARKLGLAKPSPGRGRYAVGGHYAGFGALDAQVEMYVGGGAYFALNPLSDVRANVMVVIPKGRLTEWSRDLDAGVGGAAAALARGVRSFDGAERIGARVSVGPLVHDVRRATGSGAILIGDAAGFVDPFTGQGVLLALTGAERAADAILAALAHPGRAAQEFAAYARWRADDAAWRRRLCAVISTLIDVPPLARRAALRVTRFPEAAAALMEALGGAIPPQRAFRPGVLGRLLV